jgi:hypothetical protein
VRTFSTPNPHTHPHWSAVLSIPHVATIEIPRNRQNVIARDVAYCMLAGSFRGGVETSHENFTKFHNLRPCADDCDCNGSHTMKKMQVSAHAIRTRASSGP